AAAPAEVRARQILHDQVGAAVGEVARIEDLDETAVAKLRRRPRLVEEPADQLRVVRELGEQNLEGRPPPQHRVVREVDDAHPPLPDPAQYPIISDDAADQTIWRLAPHRTFRLKRHLYDGDGIMEVRVGATGRAGCGGAGSGGRPGQLAGRLGTPPITVEAIARSSDQSARSARRPTSSRPRSRRPRQAAGTVLAITSASSRRAAPCATITRTARSSVRVEPASVPSGSRALSPSETMVWLPSA